MPALTDTFIVDEVAGLTSTDTVAELVNDGVVESVPVTVTL